MSKIPSQPKEPPKYPLMVKYLGEIRASKLRLEEQLKAKEIELQHFQEAAAVPKKDASTQTCAGDCDPECVDYKEGYLGDQATRLMARRFRSDTREQLRKRPRTPGLVTSASRSSRPVEPKLPKKEVAKPSSAPGLPGKSLACSSRKTS